MKLLFLVTSLFLTLFNNPKNKEVKMESHNEIVETINYDYLDYHIKEYQKITEVYFNDKKIETFNNPISIKYITDDKYFYIFKKEKYEDYIEVKQYNDKGALTFDKIIDNLLIGEFDVVLENNNFIIVSSIKNYNLDLFIKARSERLDLFKIDGIIFTYNLKDGVINAKVFGGSLDDYFTKLHSKDNYFYIEGKKSQESGGDFGMGGNGTWGYFLFKLSFDFTNNGYLMFKEEIKSIDLLDLIYIYTTNELYTFDYSLNQKLGLKFASECVFGKTMFNYMIGVLARDNLKIYNLKKNKLVDSYNYPFSNDIKDIKIVQNELYLNDHNKFYKTKFYNNILEGKTFIYDRFDLDRIPKEIIGLPNNLKFKEIIYDKTYNQGIFGEYDIKLNYDDVLINGNLIIKERYNVTNGYIYPLGYKLLFSGKGYLNGEEVFNNYEINEEGSYELKLVGKNETISTNFTVQGMDIGYFEDQLKDWDYEVYKNQDLFIDYKLENLENVDIKQVIVNGNEARFKVDKNKKSLNIIINEENEGIHYYTIEKIIYEKEKEEFEEIINKTISVKVISSKIELENTFTNDKKQVNISLNILNNNKNIRFIAIKTKGDNQEVTYIPLKNGNIIVNNENLSLEEAEFYLVYDTGRKYLEEQLLFTSTYDFSNKELGELELDLENGEVRNITFKFNINKYLQNIELDDQVIFEYSKKVNYVPIIITVSCVVLFFVGYKIYKVIMRKKKSKEI